jgi:HEAT repeat protein
VAAYTAERMLRTPEGVEFIRRNFKIDGSEVPAPEQVQMLIANLSHEQFSIRAGAEAELLIHARYVKAELEAVLKSSDNLEKTDRLERILKKVEDARLTPQLRRGYRAIRPLAELKTPEAANVLKGIASGHPKGWLTKAAIAASRDSHSR